MLNNLTSVVTKNVNKAVAIGTKFSPEILLGVGIFGLIGSTVWACVETRKIDVILDNAKKDIDNIKSTAEAYAIGTSVVEYTQKDAQQDLLATYVKSGFEFVKLYGPAVTLGMASIACILGSYRILSKRNVALIAAYNVLEKGFKEYRGRVANEYGEDKEYKLYHNIKDEVVEVIEKDEATGKNKKVKKVVSTANSNEPSVYAKWFDESCANWSKDPEYNLYVIKCVQNWANDELIRKGHLFLNEVYQKLGIPETQAGQLVGWVEDGDGDGVVDFNIYDNRNGVRSFVNGHERNILLDFNVDGIVWDKI